MAQSVTILASGFLGDWACEVTRELSWSQVIDKLVEKLREHPVGESEMRLMGDRAVHLGGLCARGVDGRTRQSQWMLSDWEYRTRVAFREMALVELASKLLPHLGWAPPELSALERAALEGLDLDGKKELIETLGRRV